MVILTLMAKSFLSAVKNTSTSIKKKWVLVNDLSTCKDRKEELCCFQEQFSTSLNKFKTEDNLIETPISMLHATVPKLFKIDLAYTAAVTKSLLLVSHCIHHHHFNMFPSPCMY